MFLYKIKTFLDQNVIFLDRIKMPMFELCGDHLSIRATPIDGKVSSNNLAFQLSNFPDRNDVQNVVVRCAKTIQFRTSKIVLSLASKFLKNIFLESCYKDSNATIEIVSIFLKCFGGVIILGN